MDITRRLISLSGPREFDKGIYISFAYYDENDKFTGVHEDMKVTEDELYTILKGKLTLFIRS